MAITSKDEVLHWWSAHDGMHARKGGFPVMSRGSSGFSQSQARLGFHYAADRPRTHMVKRNGLWVPTLLLEGARTNMIFPSNSDASWGKDAAITVTYDAAVAPDGALKAVKVDDTSTTGRGFFHKRSAAFTADSNVYTGSGFVRRGNRDVVTLFVDMAGGTYQAENLHLNTATGAMSATAGAKGYGAVDVGGGWWYWWLGIQNNGTNTSFGPGVIPAFTNSTATPTEDVALLGHCFIWGFQGELGSFPTSHIPTTTAAVTRSADSFYWDSAPAPQAMTLYQRFVVGDAVGSGTGSKWTLQLGGSTNAGSRLILYHQSTNGWEVFLSDGTSNSTSSVASAAAHTGAEIELKVDIAGTTSLTPTIHLRVNGGSVTSGTAGASIPNTSWGGNRLSMGSIDGVYALAGQYRELKIVKGTGHTMDEMATLAVDAHGNLL